VSKHSEKKNKLAVTVAENAALGVVGNILFMLFRLGINVVITRSLGPGSYGIYVLAASILAIPGAIARLGIPSAMIKFVSQYRAMNDIPRLKGTIFWGFGLVLVFSIVLCLGLFSLSHFLNLRIFHKPALTPVLKIMVLSLPFSCLGTVIFASLQGAKLIKYRVLVNQVLVPLCRFCFVALSIALGYRLIAVAWSYLLAIVLGTMLGGFFLIKSFPEILQKGPTLYERRKITLFSLPLIFAGVFHTILNRVNLLMVGHFLSATMVGIYATAQRLLPLMLIPLGAFNSIFAPIISDLFTREKREDLENQFKTVTKWVSMTSLPIFTLLTFFSKQILSIFGPEFVAYSQVVIILCIGQMVNAATGSTGLMLTMTGRPHINLLNSALLCVTAIFLNIYMIPRYGIVGAALVSTFSISAIQLLQLLEVWYLLGMHPYRLDFLKPILSCLFSFLLLTAISHIGLNTNSFIIIPILSAIFLISYGGFLWLLKLSPEDYVILNNLRKRLLKQRNQQLEHAA
jgi:O-antigen/teichoic acid export membrane protein